MNEINCVLVPAVHKRRRRACGALWFGKGLGRAMVFCFALGFLIGLVWVRSMDKPEGGMVPQVSITYEAVSYGSEEHR